MQVENVTRIGFTARRTTQQQGHLTVGHGLLGEVIINDQRVLAAVAEVLSHRGRGVRRQELHRSRFGRGCGNHDRVFHRTGFFQLFHQLSHGRALLADRDINTVQFLGFIVTSGVVVDFLVQDRVQSNGSFTGLTVTNDQLSLATADRDHRVNGLEAGCHRLVNRFTRDDARCFYVSNLALLGVDRAFAIQRVAQTIDNAAQQLGASGNVHDGVGALDGVTFFDVTVGAEDNDTDIVGFEVQRHAHDAAGEFDHLAGLDIVETVHTGDTVTNGQHAANLCHLSFLTKILDLVFQDRRNLCCLDTHLSDLFHCVL